MSHRRVSLELERCLLYRPDLKSYPPLGAPFGAATPMTFQAVLHDLIDTGWKPICDPCTGVVTRVAKPGLGTSDLSEEWNCTSDVTTGIIETTLVPSANIVHLQQQQSDFDAELMPILAKHGLFLLHFETPPSYIPTREHYWLFHTHWRGEYALRRQRGERHWYFAWTIGNNPCIDVSVGEAIPFMNIIHRLTGVTLFLRRLGSISGGHRSPHGRLTVRPWAYRRLWRGSPYRSDLQRVRFPQPELRGWRDYFTYLAGIRLVSLIGEDGLPCRVIGDPTFLELWLADSGRDWTATSVDGHQIRLNRPTIAHLSNLQRHVYLSRLRWNFGEQANLTDLTGAFDSEAALQQYLDTHLKKLYIEVRSDSCPPPQEELATLAFYLGLLEHLPAVSEYVFEKHSAAFWRTVLAHAEYAPLDSRIAGHWLPDVLHTLLDLARQGLSHRGFGEQLYLEPLHSRVNRLTTPADEALDVFECAGSDTAGLIALARQFGKGFERAGDGENRQTRLHVAAAGN